jgi:hypothetical protein
MRASAETILVFPAGLPEALAYAAAVEASGARVIGASSLTNDPARARYADWLALPYVHEPSFDAALLDHVERHAISAIFSSHDVIRAHLRRLLAARAPGVTLVDDDLAPAAVPTGADHQRYLRLASALSPRPRSDALGADEFSAVLARALAIRGQSGPDKLAAMMAVATTALPGDVVEIGVLSGRSAFVLAWLARRHAIGPMLCIDPWRRDEASQRDAPPMVRQAAHDRDFDRSFAEFKANLVPSFSGTANYIRETSAAVARRYGHTLVVGPTEFGVTRYGGAISLLHVDGNHDYRIVARDLADWAPRVTVGGWLIVDDYLWTFGDGPRRAVDAFLDASAGALARAFVTDGALFAQTA